MTQNAGPSMLSPIAPTKPSRAQMGNANDTGPSMSSSFAHGNGVWKLRVGKEGGPNTEMRPVTKPMDIRQFQPRVDKRFRVCYS